MKPQRPQRNTLSTPKEYSFKEIIEKIISCALEIQLLTYLRAENIVITLNDEKLKNGINRVIL
ncbi:MAG: hypothetical protein KAV45_05790 [Calditrichia bacterium]|nr:hypothetical protein [Calditrichia bacterium]